MRKLKKEPSDSAWLWALGRFGARIPLYGSLVCIVPVATAEEWIFVLLELDELSSETASAIVQIGRRTDDRTRDVSEEVGETAISRLRSARSFDQLLVSPLTEFIAPDRSDVVRTFGEPLPKGLRLESTAECLSAIAAIAAEP